MADDRLTAADRGAHFLDTLDSRADADRSRTQGNGQAARHTTPRGRFRFVSGADLARDVTPTRWLVRGFLEGESLAAFFGDPASGKSFAALDIGCSIATGTAWHGHQVAAGPAFYIAGEGHAGIAKRLRAWSNARGVPLEGAPIFVSTSAIGLCDWANAQAVAEAVDELAAEHGAPVLIIVDTLARNFGGGDENSAADMGAFIQNVDAELRSRYKATVLLVHHSGHAEKTRSRGSSALRGALDAEYRVDHDNGAVRIEAMKMKDAELPNPLAFALRVIELPILDEDGSPETSAVLDAVDYVPRCAAAEPRGKNQRAALEVLRRLYAEEREAAEADGRDPDGVRLTTTRWLNECMASDIPKRSAYDVRDALARKGLVRLEDGFVSLEDGASRSARVRVP